MNVNLKEEVQSGYYIVEEKEGKRNPMAPTYFGL